MDQQRRMDSGELKINSELITKYKSQGIVTVINIVRTTVDQ